MNIKFLLKTTEKHNCFILFQTCYRQQNKSNSTSIQAMNKILNKCKASQ